MARSGNGGAFALMILLSPFAFVYSYCKSPEQPEKKEIAKFTSVDIQGLKVPGTAADAKQSGFNICKPDYGSYACVKKEPFAFDGVKIVAAYLDLSEEDNFAINPWAGDSKGESSGPASLTYRSVELVPDVSKEEFRQALIKKGWVEHSWKGNSTLYREGVPVELKLGRSMDDRITLGPEEITVANAHVSQQKNLEIQEKAKQRRDKEVVEMMKDKS